MSPPVITNVMSEHDTAPAFTNSISQGWLALCGVLNFVLLGTTLLPEYNQICIYKTFQFFT